MKAAFSLTLCLTMSLFLVATNGYGQTYYCTNSGRLVSTGMTSAEVEKLCGKPSQAQLSNVQEPVARQNWVQWRYFSKQSRAPWDKSIAPELLLSFAQGTLIKILLNGQEINESVNCFGQGSIQKGDTYARILNICGKPDAQQKYTETILGKPQARLTMQYDRANGLPPVIMTFQADKLLTISYGS